MLTAPLALCTASPDPTSTSPLFVAASEEVNDAVPPPIPDAELEPPFIETCPLRAADAADAADAAPDVISMLPPN